MKQRGLGGEQIEGRHAVTELLIAGKRRVHEVWMVGSSGKDNFNDDMHALCKDNGVPVTIVDKKELLSRSVSEAPQGVVAFADPLAEASLDDLLSKDTTPFLLALDGVTDPHNLGALIRTAECAGVTGVVIPSHRSVNITPIVAKASAGAVEHMPVATVGGIPAALQAASRANVWTVGLDPDGRESVYDTKLADARLMLVLGAEGAGLARLTKDRCDALVNIPQYGSVASLNVSNAGAVACFAIAHRRFDA